MKLLLTIMLVTICWTPTHASNCSSCSQSLTVADNAGRSQAYTYLYSKNRKPLIFHIVSFASSQEYFNEY